MSLLNIGEQNEVIAHSTDDHVNASNQLKQININLQNELNQVKVIKQLAI